MKRYPTETWSVYNTDGTETDLATINNGGLLIAAKDGTVKVIAAANDDSGVTGEVIITISEQVSSGGGTASPVQTPPTTVPTPTPTPTPTIEPKNEQQQTITAAEVNNVQDGKVVLTLGEGKTEAILPIHVAQKISIPVEVKSGDVSIIIPAAVFQKLIDRLQGEASDSKVKIRISVVSNGNTDLSEANLKISNQIYRFDLLLIDKNGK